MVGPIDGSAVIPGLKAAHEAGIPVVVIGNPVASDGDAYVTATRVPDDKQMGTGSAELVVKAIGDGGTVVIIDGLAGQPAVTLRHEAIDPFFVEHDIEVLGVQPADWDFNKAATVTEDFLTRFPDVDGIFSLDGSMTPGVLRTVADVGYEGPVVGLGGTATELAALKAGTLWGTTCMSTAKNADAAMDVLEAIASDRTFEKTQAVISPPVTKENADTCPATGRISERRADRRLPMRKGWVVGAQLSTSHSPAHLLTRARVAEAIDRVTSSLDLDILIVGADEIPTFSAPSPTGRPVAPSASSCGIISSPTSPTCRSPTSSSTGVGKEVKAGQAGRMKAPMCARRFASHARTTHKHDKKLSPGSRTARALSL